MVATPCPVRQLHELPMPTYSRAGCVLWIKQQDAHTNSRRWSCVYVVGCSDRCCGLGDYDACMQAPFCVHPKTGKVCVPIDPAEAWDFDPDNVPTVQQLVQELTEQQQQTAGDAARVAKVSCSLALALPALWLCLGCNRRGGLLCWICMMHLPAARKCAPFLASL